MATKVKTQKDYLLTQCTIELPANVAELDSILRTSKASGKMIVLYESGGIIGVNVEQKTKTTAVNSVKVRDLLGVETKAL